MDMDDEIFRECPKCRGKGVILLGPAYAKTLRALRRRTAPVNGAALGTALHVPATAMNNRLTALERLGLAVGEWNGRERLWRAV